MKGCRKDLNVLLTSQFLSLLTRYQCPVRLATEKRHTDVTQLHKVTPKPQSCLNKDAQIKSKEMGERDKERRRESCSMKWQLSLTVSLKSALLDNQHQADVSVC